MVLTQNKELLQAVESSGDYDPSHLPSYKKYNEWPKRYTFPREQMKCLGGNKHLHPLISYPLNFSHRVSKGRYESNTQNRASDAPPGCSLDHGKVNSDLFPRGTETGHIHKDYPNKPCQHKGNRT